MIGSGPWNICAGFMESLWGFWIPIFGPRTFEFACIVSSFWIQLLGEIMSSRSWHYPHSSFFIEILFSNRSHRPFRGVSVAIFFIISRPREFYPIQFDVASRFSSLKSISWYFSPKMTGAASIMSNVGVNESINFIVIRRWRFIMPVLAIV